MSFRVTLLPSGQSFHAEATETVLEAALRSGINLGYRCNSGSCGDCRVIVRSGSCVAAFAADYPLSDAQKAQGYVLLCSINASSDMQIEAVAAKSASDVPLQQISAKVTRFQPLQDDYFELHLRTPRSSTLRFLAGQAVSLSGDFDSLRLPVASCPCNGMNLQFHLDGREKHSLTQMLLADGGGRTSIQLQGPYGEFTLDDDSRRASVFVAYGAGFAPIKSLIEHAIALEKDQSLMLFWIMPAARGHYQANYCRAWEDAFDGFVYIPLTLDDPGADAAAFGRMLSSVLARTPVETELDLYLAGPAAMIEVFDAGFQDRQTPAQQIHVLQLEVSD